MNETSAQPLLAVDGLVAGFGATTVLHGVTFSVAPAEVSGVFGLNGAGKSVTMKVLAGLVPLRGGSIRLAGEDITGLSAEARVARGITHVPQGRQVFAALTVEENLRLGAYTLRRRDRARYKPVLDAVYDRFPLLAERRTQVAGTLSGGQQAALAIGRALVADPKVMLVDEPSAGLSPMAVQDLFGTLRDVARSGVTMVLVEQNVTFGLRVVDTVNVLQTGQVVLRSSVAELDHDRLANALGIGRLLRGGLASVISDRVAAGAGARARSAADRDEARPHVRRPKTSPAERDAVKVGDRKNKPTAGPKAGDRRSATPRAATAKKAPAKKAPAKKAAPTPAAKQTSTRAARAARENGAT